MKFEFLFPFLEIVKVFAIFENLNMIINIFIYLFIYKI